MTPLILKGCKSVQYFITQQYQATLPRPCRQGGNTLCSSARSLTSAAARAAASVGTKPSATVRTARTENTAAALCASWLIQLVNGATIVSYTKAENME